MEKRPFDPNRAKRAGGLGGVENVDLREMAAQGSIYNSLNNLTELFKGTGPEDFEDVFGQLPKPWLREYYNLLTHMQSNIRRIMDKKQEQ